MQWKNWIQSKITFETEDLFLLKSIQIGKEKFGLPEKEEHLFTNFIRQDLLEREQL